MTNGEADVLLLFAACKGVRFCGIREIGLKGQSVGKVSAFAIANLTLIFRSSDHHPPHFHVRKGLEWEVRVYIDASTEENGLAYDYKFPKNRSRKFRGLSAADEKELLGKVVEHREALLTEWEQKVSLSEVI